MKYSVFFLILAVMLFAKQVQNLLLENLEWKKCLLVTSMNEQCHFVHGLCAVKFHHSPSNREGYATTSKSKKGPIKMLHLNLLVR